MSNIEHIPFIETNDRINDSIVIKTLGHPIRLKILSALYKGDCTVKYIWECLGLQQSVVSQHLAILRNRGVVGCKRRGGEMIYTIADPLAQRVIIAVLKQVLPYSDDIHQVDTDVRQNVYGDSSEVSLACRSHNQGLPGCLRLGDFKIDNITKLLA